MRPAESADKVILHAGPPEARIIERNEGPEDEIAAYVRSLWGMLIARTGGPADGATACIRGPEDGFVARDSGPGKVLAQGRSSLDPKLVRDDNPDLVFALDLSSPSPSGHAPRPGRLQDLRLQLVRYSKTLWIIHPVPDRTCDIQPLYG